MAYGFGTTFGTGTTDRLAGTLLTGGSQYTWAAWLYRHTDGGGGQGRWFQADDGATGNITVGVLDTTDMFINIQWSSSVAQWEFTTPVTDTWTHYVVTYDSGATTNNPSVFINGVDEGALTQNTADPTGSFTTSDRNIWLLGNRNTLLDRNWDGMIAEHAQWNRIVSAGEINILAAAYSPMFLPRGLVHYRPLVRETYDRRTGNAVTVTGALVQNHPRILYPAPRSVMRSPGAAAAASVARTPHFLTLGVGA